MYILLYDLGMDSQPDFAHLQIIIIPKTVWKTL